MVSRPVTNGLFPNDDMMGYAPLRSRFIVSLLLMTPVLYLIGAQSPVPPIPSNAHRSDIEARQQAGIDTLRLVSRKIFQRTNEEREQRGLDSLVFEDELRRIACQHSRDMLERDFVRHKNPDGAGPGDRVARQHRRLIGVVGENLWETTGSHRRTTTTLVNEIVEKWMDSPPHRRNILETEFSHLGVCSLEEEGRIRGTQVFAGIRAYLRSPLPRTVRAGTTIAAPIERTFPRDAPVAKYDFWDPATKKQLIGPRLFVDTLRLPDTTGTVRPRFYIPETNRYQIFRGPEMRLTSP